MHRSLNSAGVAGDDQPEQARIRWHLPLRWAVALPFFLMPVSLTINAPDVHGGYAIHARHASILAGVGGLAGLAVLVAGGLGRSAGPRPRLRRILEVLVLLPVLAAAGHGVAVLGAAVADLMGPAFGIGGRVGRVDSHGPLIATRVMIAAVALWIGVQVTSRHRLKWAVALGGVVAATIAVARLAAMAGASSAAATDVAVWVVGLGVGVGWWWLRDRGASGEPEPLAWLRGGPGAMAERLVLGFAMAAFAYATAVMIAVIGGALASALGVQPLSGLVQTASGLPRLAVGCWMLLCVVASLGVRDRASAARAVGAMAWTWALFVAGRAFGSLLGPVGFGVSWVVPTAVALLLALRRPDAWFGRAGVDRAIAAGPGALALTLGPVAGRYVVDSSVPAAVPALAGVLVGVAATAGAAVWLVRRAPAAVARPGAWARTALLLMLSPILPLYVGIAYGIDRWLTLVVLALLVASAFHKAVPARLPAWLLFYVCFGIVTVFKFGPSAGECEAVASSTSARPLLLRHAEGGDYASAEPYDVLPDPASGGVVVSFKRIDRRGGFLEVIDGAEPTRRSRLETKRPDEGAFWPERLELDPRTGRQWVQMLGFGAYAMWELAVAPGPAVEVTRRLPITWEPGNPVVDPVRNRLVMSYVPNAEPDNPLAQAFDLASLRPAAATPKPGRRMEMADFIALDPSTGRYYVPAFYGSLRFALYELEGEGLQVMGRREQFHASIGLAADGGRGAVWVTNVLAGAIVTYEPGTLRPLGSVRTGAFPRDLLVDRPRGLLHVAEYSGGSVRTYRMEEGGPGLDLVQSVPVGSLLRGIGLHPATGAVYAASGCGVFEIAAP